MHPLVNGADTHFESGRPVDDGSYLKPYKKLLVDVTASKATLKAALNLANELFNALEAAGHRVVLAPAHLQFRRLSAEEREPVGKPRQYWEHDGLWSPYRATVVFVGTVAIGLQIVEMSESVTARYVRGTYVRDADYVAPRRGYQDPGFTTIRSMPSGQLRVIAYSPYPEVAWSVSWQDTSRSTVVMALRSIVAAISAEAPRMVVKLAEAERQQQIRHQKWLVEEDLRQREADRRKVAESVVESTADLRKVIDRWANRTNIEGFLTGVERSATALPDDEKEIVMQRLVLARGFLGTQDPLDFFRNWRTPDERYPARFASPPLDR